MFHALEWRSVKQAGALGSCWPERSLRLDPQSITLFAPLAMDDTCDGLRESFQAMDLDAADVNVYEGRGDADTVAVRGAALAVVRAAV